MAVSPVDRATRRRIVKPGAEWLGGLARANEEQTIAGDFRRARSQQ